MSTKNKPQLDYKMIGMIILACIAFSGIGYGFTYVVQSLNDPNKVKGFDCNTLTEDQWHNDISGNQFKTLDEYKQFCVKDKQVILNQPYIFGVVFIVIIPIITGLICGRVFGIHKDDYEQPNNRDVA